MKIYSIALLLLFIVISLVFHFSSGSDSKTSSHEVKHVRLEQNNEFRNHINQNSLRTKDELPKAEIKKKLKIANSTKNSDNLLDKNTLWLNLDDPTLSFQEKRKLLFSLFGSEQILPDLISFYHSSNDQKLKIQIIRYLVRIGGVKAESFLREEWFKLNRIQEKLALIQALGEGITNESFDFLKDLFENDDLSTKIKTNLAHSLLNYDGGDDYVFKSLENDDAVLMNSVIESISEKNFTQNKDFLSEVMTSNLVEIDVKEDIIQAIVPDNEQAYDFLLKIIKSADNENLKLEALDKLHEIDEEEISFVNDLKNTLGNESSNEVRKAIYEALHLQDNLDVNFLLDKVIKEGNDETYLAGMQTIIHHLKLNGEDLSAIPLEEKNRVQNLANQSQNETALRLIKHM